MISNLTFASDLHVIKMLGGLLLRVVIVFSAQSVCNERGSHRFPARVVFLRLRLLQFRDQPQAPRRTGSRCWQSWTSRHEVSRLFYKLLAYSGQASASRCRQSGDELSRK